MPLTTLEQEILSQLHTLAMPQQREVLAFVRTLVAAPVGIPGNELLVLASAIESADLALLQQAIDEGCERIDADEW